MVSVQMWAVAVNLAMIAAFDGSATNGVLAPSAALPGAVNLTLFGARVASRWNRPPLLASSLPASVIAKGAPPPGLVTQVRKIGAPRTASLPTPSTRRAGAGGAGTAEDSGEG